MKTKTFSISVLAAILLAACSGNDDPSAEGNFPKDQKVRVATQLAELQTKAGPTTYTGKDLSLSIDYGTGHPLTNTHVKWTTPNNGITWMPETQMLWQDAYTPVKLYAFAPHTEHASDITAIPFSVAKDQSGELTSSDLVLYHNREFIPGIGLNEQSAINLELRHRLSKLVVSLTYGSQWDNNPPAISKVTINEILTDVLLDATTGGITAVPNTKSSIVAFASTAAYEAILVPQKVEPDTKFITIETAAGNIYNYTVSSPEGITFEADKQYNITLRVGKDKVELGGITKADWGATVDLGDADTELVPFSDPMFVAALTAEPYNIPLTNGVIDPRNPDTKTAIEKVTLLDVPERGIKTLCGIEYFTNLTSLYCDNNAIKELDVTPLKKLAFLDCHACTMEKLNVSSNTNLVDLSCYSNMLETIDIASLTKLTLLYIADNRLTELKINPLAKLDLLECYKNRLTELDIRPFPNLTYIAIGTQNDAKMQPQDLLLKLTQAQNDALNFDMYLNERIIKRILP